MIEALTPRQAEVLQLISQGEDSHTIGEHLHISPYTVKFTLKEVYRRLSAHNAPHAVAIALRQGFIQPPEERRVA